LAAAGCLSAQYISAALRATESEPVIERIAKVGDALLSFCIFLMSSYIFSLKPNQSHKFNFANNR
jgi:hypothetical protein